jgi:hypothetical protein
MWRDATAFAAAFPSNGKLVMELVIVSLKQRSPQRSLMKLDLLIRSCRQHLAPSRKPRTSTSFGLHPARE